MCASSRIEYEASVPKPQLVSFALLPYQHEAGHDVVNMGEDTPLCSGDVDGERFAVEIFLPKNFYHRAIFATALAGAIDIIEICDRIREPIPRAVIAHQF